MHHLSAVRWLTAQHSGIFGPVHTGSGYAIWVLVTPPMLWSHFTCHIYSISRTSSPRQFPSSLMFSPHHSSVRTFLRTTWTMATYRRSASGHSPHKSMSHVRRIHSGPMTTWPTATHFGQRPAVPTQGEEPLSYRSMRRLRARDPSDLRIMRAVLPQYGRALETTHISRRAIRMSGLTPTFSSGLGSRRSSTGTACCDSF